MKKLYLLLLLAFLLISCNNANNNDQTQNNNQNQQEKFIQNEIKFNETIEEFDNPDCGFYEPVYISCSDIKVSQVSKNYLKYNNLLHLRIDISSYSKANNGDSDKLFSEQMLTNLANEFEKMKNASTCVIVRFAYDPGYNGKKDMEPSIEIMLEHINQLKNIFIKYESIITAIECGMVGPWGEMHSSKIANQETYNQLIKEFLDNTASTTPILVRRPQFLYSYYGYKLDNLDELKLTSNNRLGVYNDGYLGSSTDLGTYANREKEVNWLSKVNQYLPYGGEVTIPSSEYNLLENCNSEMDILGLSYLNEYWNDQVVKRWKETQYNLDNELYKDSSQFTYIKNHLGYRLVLNKLNYKITETKFNIYLDIKNVGFGNLLKPKKYALILKNEANQLEYISNSNTYKNLSFEIDITNLKDNYDVYIMISDGYLNDIPFHSIRLSNNIWDDTLYANKLITNLNFNINNEPIEN